MIDIRANFKMFGVLNNIHRDIVFKRLGALRKAVCANARGLTTIIHRKRRFQVSVGFVKVLQRKHLDFHFIQ